MPNRQLSWLVVDGWLLVVGCWLLVVVETCHGTSLQWLVVSCYSSTPHHPTTTQSGNP
ncbi:hypothetical protein [Fischerella thermalis]|uniref:hypothetical protein n=1 Tax=Fischerella thermalis TaxID=372787 RepID=UPI0002D50B8C|nr:hypothetical protein [Fischerella thermalis]